MWAICCTWQVCSVYVNLIVCYNNYVVINLYYARSPWCTWHFCLTSKNNLAFLFSRYRMDVRWDHCASLGIKNRLITSLSCLITDDIGNLTITESRIFNVDRVFANPSTSELFFSTHPTLVSSFLYIVFCMKCMHVNCLINCKTVSLIAFWTSGTTTKEHRRMLKAFLFISGDLGKAVGELVTVMTEDTSKTNGQRAPPPAFK